MRILNQVRPVLPTRRLARPNVFSFSATRGRFNSAPVADSRRNGSMRLVRRKRYSRGYYLYRDFSSTPSRPVGNFRTRVYEAIFAKKISGIVCFHGGIGVTLDFANTQGRNIRVPISETEGFRRENKLFSKFCLPISIARCVARATLVLKFHLSDGWKWVKSRASR